jgi:hypothetical protein
MVRQIGAKIENDPITGLIVNYAFLHKFYKGGDALAAPLFGMTQALSKLIFLTSLGSKKSSRPLSG